MARAETECRTRLEPPDSVGQYGWSCDALDDEGSGYDNPFDAYAAALAHGPIAANSDRVDPRFDQQARWAPSDEQMDRALAILQSASDLHHVVVALALPGKRHGVWEAGQPVVPVPGYWPVRENAADGDPESHGVARVAAERAAAGLLRERAQTGQPSYVVIRRDLTFAAFEGYEPEGDQA